MNEINASSAAPIEAAPVAEAPRALSPGAFLKGEYEVREVVARGWTNLYLAVGGDYGNPLPKLIAEHEILAPTPTPVASEIAASETAPAPIETVVPLEIPGAPIEELAMPPIQTAPAETVSGALLTDRNEFAHGSESGAFGSEAGVFDAPQSTLAPQNTDAPIAETAPQSTLTPVSETSTTEIAPQSTLTPISETPATETAPQSTLEAPTSVAPMESEADGLDVALPDTIIAGETWQQDGREYRVWDWMETVALQDHREAPNDERYLQMLSGLAQTLAWAKARGQRLDLSREVLRVDENGDLRYFGFFSPSQSDVSLASLREVDEFLIARVFADSGTMRLDDRFAGLPLSEEVKEFARRLSENEFASFEAAHEVIKTLCGASRVRCEAALLSDVGQERELNEDAGMMIRMQRAAHLGSAAFNLFVVADGMGGHEGGEVASDLTLSALQDEILQAVRDKLNWDDNGVVRQWLLSAMQNVNARVVELTQSPAYRATRAKPGSTLTCALQIGARVFVGNVGDSRAYKWNAAQGLTRISKDHSYVQTLIDAGSLSEEDAFDHPEGSIITAHIGDPKGRTRDVFLRLMGPSDKLLLVSDGVVDMLRDRDIAPFLTEHDPEIVCRNLVDASNAAGGLDNITALCVSFY